MGKILLYLLILLATHLLTATAQSNVTSSALILVALKNLDFYYVNIIIIGTCIINHTLHVHQLVLICIAGGASSGSGQIPTLTPEDDTTTDPQSGLIDTFEQLINRILSATGIPRTAFYAICAVCGVALLSIILLFIAASIAVA